MIVSSCLRTSCARRMHRACTKLSKHHGLENLDAAHPWYTASKVKWSPSGWKNFDRLLSACVCFSFGR